MSRPAGRLTPAFAVVALALVAITVSCTEDPLALGSDTSPGATADTRDVTLAVTELPAWRDTTLSGFARPANAPFRFVSNDPVLLGRSLVRFDIPDTIRTFADTLPVDVFDSVNVFVRIDTLRSQLPDLPLTLRLVQLGLPFDPDSASWIRAGPGTSWTTPGGDLEVEVASGQLEAMQDTVFMRVTVSEDSLLKAWQDADGDDGLALLVEGSASRVYVQSMLLRYAPTLAGRELPVFQTQQPDPSTFIVDPPLPPTGEALRVGGLPASRLYLEFSPPELVDGLSLAGATINHAELVLHPLPMPPEPFAAESAIEARQITLLGDPFVLGAKTPIGSGDATTRSLDPETLAMGIPLRLNITLLFGRAIQDSAQSIRIGFRADPDPQTIGYWEFGSRESPLELRPQLRIVFSPPPAFTIP